MLLFLFIPLLLINASSSPICSSQTYDFASFALSELQSVKDMTYDYNEDGRYYRLYYNFCQPTIRTCKDRQSHAVVFELNSNRTEINDTCIRLTSSNAASSFSFSLNSPDQPSSGLALLLNSGDRVSSSLSSSSTIIQNSNSYQIIFRISCLNSNSAFIFLPDELYRDDFQFILMGKSRAGCPIVSYNVVYQFIENNRYVLGIIFFFVGLLVCFTGLGIIKETIFFIGFFSGFGFLMMLFGEFFLPTASSTFFSWLLLLIAIFLGGLNGYISTSVPKLCFLGLGFWTGFILAFIINNLFLYKVKVEPPGLLLYILMGVLGTIFGVLSICIWRHVVILGTSFLGSYLAIRSLSIMIGYYPNELTLDKQIKYGEIDEVGYEFYIYFIFLIVLSALGMMLQFRNKRKIGGRWAGIFYEPETLKSEEIEIEIKTTTNIPIKKKETLYTDNDGGVSNIGINPKNKDKSDIEIGVIERKEEEDDEEERRRRRRRKKKKSKRREEDEDDVSKNEEAQEDEY